MCIVLNPEPEASTNHINSLLQIRNSRLDVICLQEIWKSSTQRQIFSELRDLYPHAVSNVDLVTENTETTPVACTLFEVLSYGDCITSNCTTSEADIDCPVRHCRHILLSLSQECLSCLILNSGPRFNIEVCVAELASSYEKTFGLMLLSKTAITQSSAEGYLGDISQFRGFLHASVRSQSWDSL